MYGTRSMKKPENIENLIKKLEEFEEVRWYYKGDEPWSDLKDIMGELAMTLREMFKVEKDDEDYF